VIFSAQHEINLGLNAQFYIQLLYRLHFGTWILPFGLLGSECKISETTEFLLKYATFWDGFFMFSWAKKHFSIFLYIVASAIKSCFKKKWNPFSKNLGRIFSSVKNRLPLTIFWSEIVSVIQREEPGQGH